MTSTSLPLAEAGALWRFRNRTRVVRIVLGLALIGTAVGVLVLSTGGSAAATPYLGTASRGIIVLDLSASVENATLRQMHATLTRLAASKGEFGLVIFSDQAYEALPPATPASELAPYAAFFQPETRISGDLGPSGAQVSFPTYPPNPWATGFSLGTQISQGLDLARQLILADHVPDRDVWLVSDLGDEASDLPLVRTSAEGYAASGIALHILPLNPLPYDLHFFESLHFGGGVTSAHGVKPKHGTGRRRFPIGLGILGVLLAALLAVNELWSRPLEWGRTAVA